MNTTDINFILEKLNNIETELNMIKSYLKKKKSIKEGAVHKLMDVKRQFSKTPSSNSSTLPVKPDDILSPINDVERLLQPNVTKKNVTRKAIKAGMHRNPKK